jgi:hypothetical protein
MRAGLANMLMPWGRAVVWADAHGAPVLAPRWFKVRLGPYRRRERDKRRYDRCFTSDGHVAGWRRTRVLATATLVDESFEDETVGSSSAVAVRFTGLDGYLEPLLGHHELLDQRLRGMTREDLLPAESGPFVGVHVRLGDYPTAWRQPVDWYEGVVLGLRAQLGRGFPVRIFSDGTDEELSPLMALRDAVRAPERSAVTDLIQLSQAQCIVASASTFSSWAGFLRQAPMIWHPDRRMRSHDDGYAWRSVEWDGRSSLPERVLAELDERLSGGATQRSARLIDS